MPAHSKCRLSDGGELRAKGIRPEEIIEGSNRDVAGAVEPGIVDGTHHAERHEVVGTVDCVGKRIEGKYKSPRLDRSRDVGTTFDNKSWNEGQSCFVQRLPVAGQPVVDRGDGQLRLQQRNAAMAEVDQVPHRS